MQEVDCTPQLLVQFSTEFAKVPCVNMQDDNGRLNGIPFTHHVLYYWIAGLSGPAKDNSMYEKFTAWLCGRGEFLHPDASNESVPASLAKAMADVVGRVEDDS